MIRNTSQTVYWNVLKLFVFHCNLPAMTFKVWGGKFDLWNHKSGIRGVISDHAQWCFAELITLTCAVAHAAWVWGSLWVSSGARLGWFTTLGSLSLSFWPYMDRQRVSSQSSMLSASLLLPFLSSSSSIFLIFGLLKLPLLYFRQMPLSSCAHLISSHLFFLYLKS